MPYRDDYEALQQRLSALEREVEAAREQAGRIRELEQEAHELRQENERLSAELREIHRTAEAPRASAPRPGGDRAEDLFQSYLKAIDSLRIDETAVSEAELALVRAVEEAHGVAEGEREKFRSNLLNYQGALQIEGQPVVCKQLFPELYGCLLALREG